MRYISTETRYFTLLITHKYLIFMLETNRKLGARRPWIHRNLVENLYDCVLFPNTFLQREVLKVETHFAESFFFSSRARFMISMLNFIIHCNIWQTFANGTLTKWEAKAFFPSRTRSMKFMLLLHYTLQYLTNLCK